MFKSSDFAEYRSRLGFSSKKTFSDFMGAKDINPRIDFSYIERLNERLEEIFTKLNGVYYKPCNLESFLEQKLRNTFNIIKAEGIMSILNNQGRRKEEVYFSWMRGHLVCEYFREEISYIFGVQPNFVLNIGEDDFRSIQTFRRTPRADLQIYDLLRVEVQSGFQGVNDIKESKVREAQNLFRDKSITTLILHFDLFNGQVAYVDISRIEDSDINWITRQQMEGQSVFNIDQNHFKWLLHKAPVELAKEIRELAQAYGANTDKSPQCRP